MSHSVHVSLAACWPSFNDTTKLVWPSSFNVEVVNVWSVAIFLAKGNANVARGENWTTRLLDGLGRHRSWKWGWRRSPGRTRGVRSRSVVRCTRSTSDRSKTKVFIVGFWSRLRSESSSGKDLQSSIYCTFSRNMRNKLMNLGTIHVGCCDRKK